MPELPDLVHIVKALRPALIGRVVAGAAVREPIVLRITLPGSFESLVLGRRLLDLERHGPFLRFGLDSGPVPDRAKNGEAVFLESGKADGLPRLDLVMHLMLAGRLKLATRGERPLPATAFSLALDDGSTLYYGDEKKMGKVYLCAAGRFEAIPGYLSQGVDVTSEDFSFERFSSLIEGRRSQARVFIMDQSLLSAIGNAYADEILFEAGIHPKASCSTLGPEERRRLYDAVRSVLAWGIAEVEAAGRPLEDKVRDHMKVRGRAGQPCPRCGTTIRKAGVLGYDAYFCPRCQPDRAGKGIVDWTKLPPR